jgi:hypothetical protein
MSIWIVVLVLAAPITRSNTPARNAPPPSRQAPTDVRQTPAPAPVSPDRAPATITPPTAAPAPSDRLSGDRVIYKKRTIIDFTGALIEGDLIKPEGSYVVSRKASRFSSLIRVRENYLPELIASPNDL